MAADSGCPHSMQESAMQAPGCSWSTMSRTRVMMSNAGGWLRLLPRWIRGALLTPAWDRSAKPGTWAAMCTASGKLRLLVLKNILTKGRGMHGGYRVAGNAAEARWQSAHGWLGECPCEHVVHPMRNVEQTPNEVTWSGQAGHSTWLGNEETNQRPLPPW